MTDLSQASDVARTIATAALGRDPGPMAARESLSHHVHVGSDIVVKIIDAARHSRLNREIALAPHLPGGLSAPLLASGLHPLDGREIRYACYARVPGTAPDMGRPDLDAATARSLAEQAVQRLGTLHSWIPPIGARQTLTEDLDHGGFVSQEALATLVDGLATVGRAAVPSVLLDGLTVTAERAPAYARSIVPVHADSHWGNWLAVDGRVTALLDFEWARFGEPVDDWFFVLASSGIHRDTVLDVVARETATGPEALRSECEVRHATYLASDVLLALTHPDDVPARLLTQRLRQLEQVIVERYWWRPAR